MRHRGIVIDLPAEVSGIFSRLRGAGFQAYIVGGCIRDSLLGKKPGDWDIATDALPGDVKALFEKTVDTGIRHGTVTVMVNGLNFEVTSFRVDGEYRDHRRPAGIAYASSVQEDLSRRDFTANAMAYSHETGLIDPFDGIKDLQDKYIRAVGTPSLRFREDALRMLRAVRFSAQLGFEIEEETFSSIRENSCLILHISHERVREELTKILLSDYPSKIAQLRDCGLLFHILPEFDACFDTPQNHPYHIYHVAAHTLTAVAQVEKSAVLRWTLLLHDIGKPLTRTTDERGVDHFYGHPEKGARLAEDILKRLRFDKRFIERVCRLVRYHDRSIIPGEIQVRKLAAAVGKGLFPDLIKVQMADKKAQNPEYLGDRLEALEEAERIYENILIKRHCLGLEDLAVNGHDLLGIGYGPGAETGKMLRKLLNIVLEDPGMNTRDRLLEIAAAGLKDHIG